MDDATGRLSEHEAIRRAVLRLGGGSDPRVEVGIGDDAAVVRLDGRQIVTTDLLVEGVHFDLRYMSLADVGYKALAVNLSDVNAMGGQSTLALGQLGIPRTATAAEVDALLDGVAAAVALAQHAGQRIRLIGGDTVAAPQWIAGFTVVGEPAGEPLLRSGARPGDLLWHSGELGLSTLGLHQLWGAVGVPPARPAGATGNKGVRASAPANQRPETAALPSIHLRPQSPLRLGPWLAQPGRATAAQDLSDSLSQVVCQLAAASGVGLRLDFSSYRFNAAFVAYAALLRQPDGSYVVPAELNPGGSELHFGSLAELLLSCAEDYGLLFSAPPEADLSGAPAGLTRLGEVIEASAGLRYRDERGEWHELTPRGYSHLG